MDRLPTRRHLTANNRVPLLVPKVVAVAEETRFVDYVPSSSGSAPTPLDSGNRPVQLPQGGLAEKSQVIPSHLKALEAMPIDWISLPEGNLPFDSARSD